MAILILEISQRGRGPALVQRVEKLPFTIGRGYHNDLCLADDTVSEQHLLLTQDEDGQLVALNRSQENGTQIGSRNLGERPVVLRLPQSLRLGHSQIRLVDPNVALAPAWRLMPDHWLTRWCSRLPVALILLTVLLLAELWYSNPDRSSGRPWQQWLLSGVTTLLAPLLIAALTGFISRLLLHRWHYPLQLSIATLVLLIFGGSHMLLPRLDYLLTSSAAADLAQLAMLTILLPLFGAWQLSAVSAMAGRKAMIISCAVVIPLLLLGQLNSWLGKPEFNSQPPLDTSLVWPDWRLAKTEPLDQFLVATKGDLQQMVRDELESETPAMADNDEMIDTD